MLLNEATEACSGIKIRGLDMMTRETHRSLDKEMDERIQADRDPTPESKPKPVDTESLPPKKTTEGATD